MKKKDRVEPLSKPTAALDVIRRNVAGIDIGSRYLHVCGPANAAGVRELRVFATTTVAIEQCARWLKTQKVESVAMESTGVYWIPVLEILEGHGFETLLVDTRPLARVPGRKTDVLDCEWLQTLHSHGLLRSSFRPSEDIAQMRSLVRQKSVLGREQADWTRRMHQCLDQMNVRVHHAVADTQGTTGMQIIRAIVGGERDPRTLAQLRDPRCRKTVDEIAEHLSGHWREDHLFNLEQALGMYDAIADRLAAYELKIQQHMNKLTPPARRDGTAPPLPNRERMKAMKRRHQEPKRQALYGMAAVDLTTIDGIGVDIAETILSEYGTELSRFDNEKAFVAHLQLAPRQSVSGGHPIKKGRRQNKSTRTGQALRTAAVACSRGSTALAAYYRRISRTKGATIAVFATARKIATLVYRLLRWGQQYVDIGQQAYEGLYQAARIRALARTADQFGFTLTAKSEGGVNS